MAPLVLAAIRIRDVFQSYLDRMQLFHPPSFAGENPKAAKLPKLGSYSMISIYCTLMLLGGVISFGGAFFLFWPFCFSKWIGVVTLATVLALIYFMLFTHDKKTQQD